MDENERGYARATSRRRYFTRAVLVGVIATLVLVAQHAVGCRAPFISIVLFICGIVRWFMYLSVYVYCLASSELYHFATLAMPSSSEILASNEK